MQTFNFFTAAPILAMPVFQQQYRRLNLKEQKTIELIASTLAAAFSLPEAEIKTVNESPIDKTISILNVKMNYMGKTVMYIKEPAEDRFEYILNLYLLPTISDERRRSLMAEFRDIFKEAGAIKLVYTVRKTFSDFTTGKIDYYLSPIFDKEAHTL
ncbi:MAG: hypothetical protein ACP5TK_02795 [Candidatus Micrarchaeia archaeon]